MAWGVLWLRIMKEVRSWNDVLFSISKDSFMGRTSDARKIASFLAKLARRACYRDVFMKEFQVVGWFVYAMLKALSNVNTSGRSFSVRPWAEEMAEGRSDHPTSAPAITVHASSFTNMLDLLGNPWRVDFPAPMVPL